MEQSGKNFSNLLDELNKIGISLSAEKNHVQLLELILTKAMEITNADGGTLYSLTDDKRLKFEILYNKSLKIHKGGTSADKIGFYPIHLYDDQGNPNNSMVAAWSANNGETVNVPDAYATDVFDFSGTRNFDQKTGYRSISFLTVPMQNHENEVIGILQLINAMERGSGKVIPFSLLEQQMVQSMASQAAVTITNQILIQAQKNLFDSLIQLIANAIDEKSPHTAGHCRRVPVITNMLADAVNNIDRGPLKDFKMTDDEKYELEVAAWLHDCGKLTTPECVVNKGTKLETIFDRINLVDVRIEVLKRDAVIQALKTRLGKFDGKANIDEELLKDFFLQNKLKRLEQDREDIHRCNIGSESLHESDLARIEQIAQYTWVNPEGETTTLLSEEEVENLQISRGTLTSEEKKIIGNHVAVTIKMLESLPYPKHLKRVPEYAGGHHEKVDGTGYPNKLTGDEMSVQARIMAIADIFEALTAKDRPYKKAMPLSKTLQILGQMKIDNHIDADLFDVFIHNRVYLDYAKQYLDASQIDDINLAEVPGYTPLN